jgi:hypothetical protein
MLFISQLIATTALEYIISNSMQHIGFLGVFKKKEAMLTDSPKSIEKLIIENRDKFCVDPEETHMDKFLFKLNYRIRHFISIVPYLVKVAVATALIFAGSVIIWNNYIRKDRHEIRLQDKISTIVKTVF